MNNRKDCGGLDFLIKSPFEGNYCVTIEQKRETVASDATNANGGIGLLVPAEAPGIYTLPENLIHKKFELSPGYLEFARYIRAHRSLIAYIRYLFGFDTK